MLRVFSWLNTIPLRGCTIFCVSIHQWMDLFLLFYAFPVIRHWNWEREVTYATGKSAMVCRNNAANVRIQAPTLQPPNSLAFIFTSALEIHPVTSPCWSDHKKDAVHPNRITNRNPFLSSSLGSPRQGNSQKCSWEGNPKLFGIAWLLGYITPRIFKITDRTEKVFQVIRIFVLKNNSPELAF